MKTIGLIGGLSWESTVAHYRQINETVKARKQSFRAVRRYRFWSVNTTRRSPLFDTTAIHARRAAEWALTAG